ncbi:type VII secretion protein EccB [Nocardia alni]|uniref:type VII secretion protein EccB n=1 Tax=Nocardia alni TaxID=2815723 RepID=UPI001C21B919|nr:type VII secretion protein EccB [Nocardia alni]
MARFRVVTRYQISGWRFLFRRIEHALVRRDASMIDDPQRGRSTALSVGIALACVVILGSAVLAFFKPAKQVAQAKIVAEKDTGALFVHLGDRLYPALNLTSARLIVGSPDNPVPVSDDELSKYPRGPLVGIPGAPGSIVDSGPRDSEWTVCDTERTGAQAPVNQAGLPTTAERPVWTTLIGGPLSVDGDTDRGLAAGEARLMRSGTTTWLVYLDGADHIVRAAVDLTDSAVVLALGIDSSAPVMVASPGLINAIPEAPAITVPQLPGAGSTVTLSSGMSASIGSVLTVSAPDRPQLYYVVSNSGVVQVSPVLATMLSSANSHGSVSPMMVGPDVIAASLRPGTWPGTQTYPEQPVRLVDSERFTVSCYHWSHTASAQNAVTDLIVGKRLPLPENQQNSPVSLVTASLSNGTTADAAYLAGSVGRFVQVTGADQQSSRREALYWVSGSGVRYGIDATLGGSAGDPTLAGLGLRTPILAPWSIVSLFAVGPTLSQKDSRLAHDGVAADKAVAGLGDGQ